jgi:hypothetical protein
MYLTALALYREHPDHLVRFALHDEHLRPLLTRPRHTAHGCGARLRARLCQPPAEPSNSLQGCPGTRDLHPVFLSALLPSPLV